VNNCFAVRLLIFPLPPHFGQIVTSSTMIPSALTSIVVHRKPFPAHFPVV